MCSYCGSPIPSDRKPGFNEVCDSCGKDLHSCVNCRFYRPGARWDCTESSVQEPITDKDSRNYCDWFETRPELLSASAGHGAARSAAEKARKDLGKLFGE